MTGEEPPPHSGELKRALAQAGGATQSQLSRRKKKEKERKEEQDPRKKKKKKKKKKEEKKKRRKKRRRGFSPRRAETLNCIFRTVKRNRNEIEAQKKTDFEPPT